MHSRLTPLRHYNAVVSPISIYLCLLFIFFFNHTAPTEIYTLSLHDALPILIEVRNQADGLIHATNKSLADLGDKVEEAEKKDIEAAIEALQEAMKGDDKAAIEAKTTELGEKSGKLAERVYKEQAEAEKGAAGGAAPEGTADAAADADVVDAGVEEVKDADSK